MRPLKEGEDHLGTCPAPSSPGTFISALWVCCLRQEDPCFIQGLEVKPITLVGLGAGCSGGWLGGYGRAPLRVMQPCLIHGWLLSVMIISSSFAEYCELFLFTQEWSSHSNPRGSDELPCNSQEGYSCSPAKITQL